MKTSAPWLSREDEGELIPADNGPLAALSGYRIAHQGEAPTLVESRRGHHLPRLFVRGRRATLPAVHGPLVIGS